MRRTPIRVAIKNELVSSGWYLKRVRNVPTGISWAWDYKRLLPNTVTQTLIDIGANIGQTTKFMRREFPHATIHAFEPIPDAFSILKDRTSSMCHVILHNTAISDSDGIMTIKYLGTSQQNSLDSSRLDSNPSAKQAMISLATLDAVCSKHRISMIDVLKTDTEGHDTHVLRGAKSLLSSGAIKVVVTEVTFDRMDRLHTSFSDIDEILLPAGFLLCGLYETETLQRNPAGGTYCNAMFVQRKLLPKT